MQFDDAAAMVKTLYHIRQDAGGTFKPARYSGCKIVHRDQQTSGFQDDAAVDRGRLNAAMPWKKYYTFFAALQDETKGMHGREDYKHRSERVIGKPSPTDFGRALVSESPHIV